MYDYARESFKNQRCLSSTKTDTKISFFNNNYMLQIRYQALRLKHLVWKLSFTNTTEH